MSAEPPLIIGGMEHRQWVYSYFYQLIEWVGVCQTTLFHFKSKIELYHLEQKTIIVKKGINFFMEDKLKPFIKKLLKRGCITVSSEETIKQVAALLAKNSIGAVPVTNKNEEVIGIVSERDIVRNFNNRDVDITSEKVATIMTKSVISAPKTVSSSDLMEIMTENKIRHVVIMEGKALLGIVSIGDVVKRLIEKLEGEAEQLRFFINS